MIVIDDGSTDDTATVAAQAGVRYLRQANAGPAAARNRGWLQARDFVVFTDDDCVPTARWLVELMAELDEHPELAAVGGAVPSAGVDWRSSYVQAEHLVDHGSDDRRGVRFLVMAERGGATKRVRNGRRIRRNVPLARRRGHRPQLPPPLVGRSLGITRDAAVLHDHRTSWRGTSARIASTGGPGVPSRNATSKRRRAPAWARYCTSRTGGTGTAVTGAAVGPCKPRPSCCCAPSDLRVSAGLLRGWPPRQGNDLGRRMSVGNHERALRPTSQWAADGVLGARGVAAVGRRGVDRGPGVGLGHRRLR